MAHNWGDSASSPRLSGDFEGPPSRAASRSSRSRSRSRSSRSSLSVRDMHAEHSARARRRRQSTASNSQGRAHASRSISPASDRAYGNGVARGSTANPQLGTTYHGSFMMPRQSVTMRAAKAAAGPANSQAAGGGFMSKRKSQDRRVRQKNTRLHSRTPTADRSPGAKPTRIDDLPVQAVVSSSPSSSSLGSSEGRRRRDADDDADSDEDSDEAGAGAGAGEYDIGRRDFDYRPDETTALLPRQRARSSVSSHRSTGSNPIAVPTRFQKRRSSVMSHKGSMAPEASMPAWFGQRASVSRSGAGGGGGSTPAGLVRQNSERTRGDMVIDMEDSENSDAIPEEREEDEEGREAAEARGRRDDEERLTADMADDKNEEDKQRLAEDDVCFPLNDLDATDDDEFGLTGSHSDPDFSLLDDYAKAEAEEQEHMMGSVGKTIRHQQLNEPVRINGRYRTQGLYARKELDRPFRFTFFGEDLDATIHSPTLFELTQEEQTFEELFSSTNIWWLDVKDPTDREMKVLSRCFGIHPLTTEDISTEEAREKVELFRHYYLVSFKSFDQLLDDNESEFEPQSIYIVVFRGGVLTFHFGPTPHCANVRRRIRQLRDYITFSADWISYALIDDITDTFQPVINRIEMEVDTIDTLVLGIDEAAGNKPKGGDEGNMLRRIGECRKQVMSLLRLLGTKADVVRGFAKRCNEQWDVAPKSEIGLYLGDIQDHIVTMVQNLNHYEKILSRAHSNYLAMISIEMTRVNNDTNDVVSRLTILGTIIFPMNLVTGLWGMNVPVPGQEAHGLAWFFSITMALALFAVFTAFVCRWYRII